MRGGTVLSADFFSAKMCYNNSIIVLVFAFPSLQVFPNQYLHTQLNHYFISAHIACAIKAEADYFLTTDDGILKKAHLVKDIKIADPIGFIKEVSL